MTYTSAPLNTIKSIVASNWTDFIKELKLTVGQGKQQPHRLMYQDSYFKCLLVNGENEGFVECLNQITGNEVDVLVLIDMLYVAASMNNTTEVTLRTVKPQTLTETPETYAKTEAETRGSDVEVSVIKPRANSRKRSKKQGD